MNHVSVHQIHGSKTIVIYCGNCTGALHLALPMPAGELVSATDQFAARHEVCKTQAKPAGPF